MNKVAKNTMWYMIGTFIYFFCQWLMTILVVRLSGSYEEAGVYGLANSICNIFVMLANFSVRTYQVADIDNKFSSGEYVSFRLMTCAATLVILPVYLLIMGYSLYIFWSAMCFMLLKTGEALIDVFQGIFQKEWRLDIVCKSLIIRGIANLAIFSVTEYLFKNLAISLLLTAIMSLICAFIFDFKPCYSMFRFEIRFKNRNIFKLFVKCLPLFLHGILSTLIANIPRLSAQSILGEEMLGYYSSVAIPAVVVQVAAGNIFSPCVPLLSEQYKNNDRKIWRTIMKIIAITLGIGLCAMIGFALLGDWFLEFVFGKEIMGYTDLLIPAIIVSILTALSWFMAAIFTVINRNITMVIAEDCVTLVALIISPIFINRNGLQGVNWALISSYSIFMIVSLALIIPQIARHCRKVV